MTMLVARITAAFAAVAADIKVLKASSGAAKSSGTATLLFSAGARSQTFSIVDDNATVGCKIYMVADGTSDELEMDTFICAAACTVAGTITARITAVPGPVVGSRTFNYLIG